MNTSTALFNNSTNAGLQIGQNNSNVEFHNHHASRNEACLRDLRITNPRDDKARIQDFKGGLLMDSYRWVLSNHEFRKWRNDGGPDRDANDRLLWIRADPGKGKTMLLCGIIDELTKKLPETRALSYFFYQQSDARLNDATSVLRGLIFLLVDQGPNLLSYIRPRYDVEGKTLFEDTNAWYALSEMFLELLEDRDLETTLLIIDALDECSTGLPLLLELVKRSTGNPRVKWIVSSRNWPDIEKHLTATYCSTLSLELNENSVAAAVKTYIQIKVDFLTALNGYDENTKDFTREYLTSNSNDTFLWVALVCERLAKTSVCDVETILTSFPASLDDLYKRMMGDIENSESRQLCQVVLATVCTAYRPLAVEELPVLTDLPSRISTDSRMIEQIIKLCGSFLSIREDTIYFVHQSAKDFLLTSNLIIPTGLGMEHGRIFSRCIKEMNQALQRNIYNIRNPGSRYCCTYWINHLLEADPRKTVDLSTDGPLQLFLEQKLLYWLEALSILGQFTGGIGAILLLNAFLEKAKCADKLLNLVNDISRYMREFKIPIETSPLQVYSSVLIWSPNRSLVKALYQHERPTWITKTPMVEEHWSRCIHTIVGNGCAIEEIGWSQDGDRLLRMAADLTVSSWDPGTGQHISSIKLERLSSRFNRYRLSRHTGRVASVYGDDCAKIRICDATTGKCIRILDDESLHSHEFVRWVGDGKHLVSDSDGGTQLWDVSKTPDQECWSHDGCLYIAKPSSISDRHKHRHTIYDSRTGVCLRILENDEWLHVNADSWSPDGSMLALISMNGVVIWDLATWGPGHVLEGNPKWVNQLSWSPDSTRLATSDCDGGIMIWDPKLGICLWAVERDENFPTNRFCWAPDGNRLASYSRYLIRIWDTTPTRNFPAFAEDYAQVATRTHPRHGRALAYVRSQFTKLRRKALDQRIPRSPVSYGWIVSLYWSHDRARVASLTSEGILEIWNTETSYRVCEIEDTFSRWTMAMAWSSDGKLATFDKVVLCVWDIVSGKRLLALSHNTGGISEGPGSFAWSPDGCQLASAKGGTVKIWDFATGQCLRELHHSDLLQTLAWSRGGQKVASVSQRDGTVRVWDLATGQYLELCVPTGHNYLSFDRQWHVTWSHDNSRITWGPNNYGFLYDAANGMHIGSLKVYVLEHDKSEQPILDIWGTSLVFNIWDLITSRSRGAVDQSVCSITIYWLVENGLETSLGVFDLKGMGCLDDAAENSPWVPVGYGISLDNSWITWNGDNLLWLPWQYRPPFKSCIRQSGANVAIACCSGRVIFLSFAKNPLS
ncbi:hypothetical protein BO86DRAFT_421007 [Aspergillus japonicus CBS 114.51]|uniref:NACHT domain-containing protein n=1 Tax=Aspergillus japonicus CBS 114.51 TaxID=1448312 RepID=A0A8T8WTX7_ASPJA|nr:hypothetical protein BO86DRAFT_421007 [Aspergillus japonicus CBS 114.51]RAH79241.1 hypothetical protein BO86DRAFT_421007 [Aspergillus japonicus CBS 114.51]